MKFILVGILDSYALLIPFIMFPFISLDIVVLLLLISYLYFRFVRKYIEKKYNVPYPWDRKGWEKL